MVLHHNKKGSAGCLSFGLLVQKLSSGFRTRLAIFLVEFFDTTGCVHNFLCPSVERVAFRTNFNMQRFTQCGFSFKCIAAAAIYGYFVILWMNISFHFCSLLKLGAAVVRARNLRIRARIIHEIQGLCNFHFISIAGAARVVWVKQDRDIFRN